MVSYGRKLNKFGSPCPEVYGFVQNSGLLSLCTIGYEVADKGLITAFIERWHRDTNSFHLPMGEMTITLDDVSSILHIPIMGQFPTYMTLGYDESSSLLVELLGVVQTRANEELRQCRSSYVRLSWLREVYEDSCTGQLWEYGARAFLLHLVGCTIFADKSATSISVSYLALFRDLPVCGGYAWGAAALAYTYEQLGDACFAHTRQLGGYITLIQVRLTINLM